MSLDVELIDRLALILYTPVLLDLDTGEPLDHILEVAILLASKGLDTVEEGIAPYVDRAGLDTHLPYGCRRGLEADGAGVSWEFGDT